MKLLETEFGVQDRTLKQIRREGRIALYELYGPSPLMEGPRRAEKLLYGYEVHVVWSVPEHQAFGKTFVEAEVSPRSEEWGTYGFSYQARDPFGALVRFYGLQLKYPGDVCPKRNKADSRSEEGTDG